MPISLRTLCLVTLVLCNIHGSLEHEIPRRSFLSRRAIDGTRGRKYFDPEEEGVFDSYGSAGGQYDPYEEKTDLSDIRRNVPGEPGIDYPAYTTLPQTGFTCEGRSRGYYADEVAGCQVFHVCHDVLVSSFLCPIGSLFSQKLLTCDWWTKVDCPSSGKYIDVNRNSYQQDDDEMIRNAYAMISLQSGTDVTKDGLVDPDRTGSIIDYQRVTGRLFDYSPGDSTGNDLRNTFEDYPKSVIRNFLPPYQAKAKKPETTRSYQESFYPREKTGSPYEDSPIIRIQKIKNSGDQRPRGFQDTYRRPNEFSNHFQPSYAPTVPTVTTTTRRFYSPTVPTTTFRPSTVAYNKLDQAIDSSEYYFSHSGTKSLVTPPTRIIHEEDRRLTQEAKKIHDSYEDDYADENIEERGRTKERFEVRVAEDLRFNQSSVHHRGPLFDEDYRGFDEEGIEDIETRGSIGLGHALNLPYRGISVQQQNPVKDDDKSGKSDSTGKEKTKADYQHTLARPESVPNVGDVEETTEQYQRDDPTGLESLVPSTTPSFVESTIKASTVSFNATYGGSEKEKSGVDRVNGPGESSENHKFQIKVPDLSEVSSLLIRYSTLDDSSDFGARTTELPRFQDIYSDDYADKQPIDDEVSVTSNYGDGEGFTGSRIQSYSTSRPLISSTGQWFSTSSDLVSRTSSSLFEKDTQEKIVSSHEKTVNRGICLDQLGKPCNATSGSGSSVSLEESSVLTSFGNGSESGTNSRRTFYDPSASILHTFVETATQKVSDGTLPGSINKLVSNEFSEPISKPVTQRSLENIGGKLENAENRKEVIESSTVNAFFKSITPETLKQIEDNIDKHNSPYQVTLTVNKDQGLVPSDDLIGKFVTHQNGQTPIPSDKFHELEIVKSIEPEEIRTEPEATTTSALDYDNYQDTDVNFTSESVDSLKNRSTISLLQLMSELLKLDRAPRPFSFGNEGSRTQTSGAQRIAEDVNSSMLAKEDVPRQLEETATGKNSTSQVKTPVPLKEKILGQLAEHFGEPLYKSDRYFELPQPKRTLDFQTGLPLKSSKSNEGFTDESSSKIAEASPKVSTEAPTTTTTTQRTVLTTEAAKTVVKTEFLPSIGFTFDTDEGREEYVEAVLGGLIEPQPAESEKKNIVVGVDSGSRNGTSDRKVDKSGEGAESLEKEVRVSEKV
ncbi:uncharacterized protein LOC116431068 [Nomia melanderi]|uniref:uncharacterized protein LOC116431068 n=1 Tax=Nomia melanderi TaxID=2448451 RepID=UPI003FCD8FF9